jgi:hydrogenase expression/formation protein HypD
MTLKHLEEYRDPELSRSLFERIKKSSRRDIRLMEVCGTHTMSIFRSGIRSMLPQTISLLSGPGCPVCVTAQKEIDAFILLAAGPDVIITSFGDLIRVPGSGSSLEKERADGRDIRVVYATSDALEIAEKHPEKQVVFLGVGFETTAPTVAASIAAAKERGLGNYSVYSAHKLVPPALLHLIESQRVNVDGLILPGHVSVIIGTQAYLPLVEKYAVPCAVAGVEPVDILQAIAGLVEQIESGQARLENAYRRAVTWQGNEKARKLLQTVFKVADADWRGLGAIPGSGLKIRKAFAAFDAAKRFNIDVPEALEPKGCACGEVLTGVIKPDQCPLYKKVCTPADPVGPCMVSSEGTCAAYYRYHKADGG